MLSLPVAILDSVFSAFISFIVCFIILNFYIDKPYSIIFSIIISIPIFIIAFDKISKSKSLQLAKKQNQKNLENMCNSLCLLPKPQLISLFEKALSICGYAPTKTSQGLSLPKQKAFIYPVFSFDGITKTDIVKAFNCIKKGQVAYIFGKDVSSEISSFIDRFDNSVIFIDQQKIYSLLQKTDCLPKEKPPFKTNKLTFKSFFNPFLNRANAKKFVLFGLLFILMSYFAPIKLYYIIVGTSFLIFSLFLRLFTRKEQSK